MPLFCLKGRGGSIVGRASQVTVSAKESTSEVQLAFFICMVGAFSCRHDSYISHIKIFFKKKISMLHSTCSPIIITKNNVGSFG